MGRPRVKMDVELLRQLRKAGLGWRTIASRYYSLTGQYLSYMTLKRRCIEAELAMHIQDEGLHDDHHNNG